MMTKVTSTTTSVQRPEPLYFEMVAASFFALESFPRYNTGRFLAAFLTFNIAHEYGHRCF
ncbi:hypothetical protein [Allorhodopirellula heiligendammensis]|uniref:Uncharacterized protein n=1 Tax=Allorhodopirellula heiligendammensis TaxID=2714739 RepID=A0A5C6C1A5_9BACT|nr:hypothetical protein [Allorhodopirellula heiligendammensis]TWU16629.1 hypothetical protein Poly21_38340 [Allorhodopirellula heiligendammensis]